MVNHILEKEEAKCSRAHMYVNKDKKDVRKAPC